MNLPGEPTVHHPGDGGTADGKPSPTLHLLTSDKLKEITEIASRFNIDGTPVGISPLGNGLINDTYLVETDRGMKYALQRINTAIFSDPDILQENLRLISDHIAKVLTEKGVKDIDRRRLIIIPTVQGESWLRHEDSAWRMTMYIRGSHTEERITPDTARLTGHAFAEFHSYFCRQDAPTLKETIPDFHNIAFRISQLRKAAADNSADRLQWVNDLVDYLLSREDEMLEANRLHQQGKLPRRISHCDTKLNNVLFDENGEILCVIDLDTTMPGFLLSDFGDFIRTAASTAPEDEEDISKITVDMEIFTNFAKGYLDNAPFLTQEERDTLPFGAKMLTYMQAVRFLTDYLNGDIYYKTLYPEHNLIRTRAQIRLLREIDANYAGMKAIVAAK